MTQTQNYTTNFITERSSQEAFEAICDVRDWWSQEVKGVTDQVGAEFDYHYQDVHSCKVRVTGLVPGKKVAWLVVDNHFNFIEDQNEWKGTEVVFTISDKDIGTEVQFIHVGLIPQYDCYDVCANAWSGYINGSLRDLINTGTGQPNPKEDGDLPDHQGTANIHRAKASS